MKTNTKIKKTLLITGIVGFIALGLGFSLTNHKTNIEENLKTTISQNNNLGGSFVKMKSITFRDYASTDARVDWFDRSGNEHHKDGIVGAGQSKLVVAAAYGSRFDVQYWRLTDAHYTYAGSKTVDDSWSTAKMFGSTFKAHVRFS